MWQLEGCVVKSLAVDSASCFVALQLHEYMIPKLFSLLRQQHLELDTVISLHSSLPCHCGGLMFFLPPSTQLRVEGCCDPIVCC